MNAAILLVDDCDSLRSVLARHLTRQGYKVLEASTDLEALQICDEFAGGIKLLITDVNLPEVSGIELAIRVRAIRPEAEVLYMSGQAQNGIIESSLPFMMKPFRLDELVERVRFLIGEPNLVRTGLEMPAEPGLLAAW
jgi:DNA-binding response OmpR family regulator